MYMVLWWCVLTRGAADCLSRMGLPYAPPATGGWPPVGRPFCASASEVPPASNTATTIVRVFKVVMFILPKHDALTRTCNENVSASVSFTALQHFCTENPGREGGARPRFAYRGFAVMEDCGAV
jgi:hypothetical protein